MRSKSKSFYMFKIFKARVERENGKRFKCLRLDRGGEFTSHESNAYCEEKYIIRKMLSHRTPQPNGIAKRRNSSIINCARTLKLLKCVAYSFYREALSVVVCTLKMVQQKKGMNKTPYGFWYCWSPGVSYLKVFEVDAT